MLQNCGHGWTTKSGKRESVSEVVGASDREELKKQESVRRGGDFGQGRAEKERVCPKWW
ncbi:hypothetical protein MLOOGBEN_14620 [Bacillus sp. EB106-08-02-XG196]|nr:hypothetical protein [Bacillus sp. EB106-08-02-XG196]